MKQVNEFVAEFNVLESSGTKCIVLFAYSVGGISGRKLFINNKTLF